MTKIDLMKKALSIAVTAHKGVKDKGGTDCVLHPITVALMCKTYDEKIVALLHDVIEDTPLTLDDIKKQGFPEYIVSALDAVTRRKPEEQFGDKRLDYIVRCKKNPIARVVKIADLTHNSDLTRIPCPTDDFKKKVLYEYPSEIAYLKNKN